MLGMQQGWNSLAPALLGHSQANRRQGWVVVKGTRSRGHMKVAGKGLLEVRAPGAMSKH